MTEAVIIYKSKDWFLYGNELCHERVKKTLKYPVFPFLKKSLAYSFVQCLQPQHDQNRSHYYSYWH